jgi:hypothetical protein
MGTARMQSESFYIPCRIERGGFSSERTFEIDLPNGMLVVGTSDVRYLRDEGKQPIDEEVPGFGESTSGFVKCRVLRHEDSSVLIEVPSSDAVYVSKNSLVRLD